MAFTTRKNATVLANNKAVLQIQSYVGEYKDAASLATCSLGFYNQSRTVLTKRSLLILLQAVIDDDRKTVKKILESNPKLLFVDPCSIGIKEIVSKLTLQCFETENVFVMAWSLKRLEMLKVILPILDQYMEQNKLSDIEYRQIAIAFKKYPLQALKVQQEANEVLQKKYYEEYLLEPIQAINRDLTVRTVAKLTTVKTNEKHDMYYLETNNDTNVAITAFRKKLSKMEAKEQIDVEQLLTVAYKMLYKFETSPNHMQAYSIFVVGFIQRNTNPELARLLCNGMGQIYSFLQTLEKSKSRPEEIQRKKLQILQMLNSPKQHIALKNNVLFYDHTEYLSGLGFNYCCDPFNGEISPVLFCGGTKPGMIAAEVLTKYVYEKHEELEKIQTEYQQKLEKIIKNNAVAIQHKS